MKIELLLFYIGCLVGAIFWLRASETDVSKGFAITFLVISSFWLLIYSSGLIGSYMLTR